MQPSHRYLGREYIATHAWKASLLYMMLSRMTFDIPLLKG